jgi:hypothetical protein
MVSTRWNPSVTPEHDGKQAGVQQVLHGRPEFFTSGQSYCHDHANHLKDMKVLWRSRAFSQAASIHERHTEFMNGRGDD